ncbi:MAG: class I SAM-dependent methyltransferase, partial [Planctomycetota bacterium]
DDLPPALQALWAPIRSQALAESDSAEAEADARRLVQVLAERRMDSRSFFGRVAGEWQHHRSTLFGSGFTAPALLSLLRPDWTVADLGCGSGDASRHLAPCVERVIAVDQSEAMLEAARGAVGDLPNVELLAADLEALPIADRSIDAAIVSLVLHHVERPVDVLGEAARLLRTDRGGGTLILIDMLAHDRDEYKRTMGHIHLGFTPAQIESMLTQAGFGAISCRELPTSSKTKGPGLFVAAGRLTI